jgi:hypothetical protein
VPKEVRVIRETDDECSLLISTIRDRTNTVGGLYGTNSEVVRLMGNLEARIAEKDDRERQKKEKAREMAVAHEKEQEKSSDQATTKNLKLQYSYNLHRDVDALADELTLLRGQNDELRKQNELQRLSDRLSERSPYLSQAVHAEVVREVGERLDPVCKAITKIEQNAYNARTEFAKAREAALGLSEGPYRAELVKSALHIIDTGVVDSKLYEAALAFLFKALGVPDLG